MRIGVIGSRKFKNLTSVQEFIKSLSHDSIIVSGGCSGPDTWAIEEASLIGLETLVFLPEKVLKGSPRYKFTESFYARNRLIVENSDIIHAFVSENRKGGTEYTIKYATKKGIPVIIHYP